MGLNCSRRSAIRTKNSLEHLPSLISIKYFETNSRSSTFVQPKRQKIVDVNHDEVEAVRFVQQSPPTPSPTPPQTRSSSPENRSLPTLENAIVVWLVNESNRNETEIDRMERRFRSFQLFTNVDEFHSFMFQLTTEQVLLIFSDELGQNILPLIHSSSQCLAFFILDRQQSISQTWKKSYRKIQNIFNDFQSMFEQICSQILLEKNDQMPIECVENTSIGYRDAFQEMIQNETDYRQESRRSFIDLARQNHPDQLTSIDEFERTYTCENSISWFTKKSFVYSMINDAYRTKDVKQLLSTSFIIQDIQKEIEEHCRVENESETEPLNVFCGQGMTEKEIEEFQSNEKTSNYLSFPNFLWSTTDRSSALNKAHLARNHAKYWGTLFSIEIQSTIPHVPLDFYTESSNEILFSLNGFFQIKNFKQIENFVWQVDLIYISKTHPDVIEEHRLFTKSYQGATNWEKISSYLIETKQFHQAEIMQKALIELNFLHDAKQLAILHEQLAFIYDQMKHFDQSLVHYKKSLKFYLTILSSRDEYLLVIYQEIGILLYHKKQYNLAVKYFKYALAIALHASQIDYVQIADFYHLIGKSFEEEGDSLEAIVYYQYSLENKFRQDPVDHLWVAESYRTIGDIFAQIFDSSTALSFFFKALKIQKQCLPPNHSLLAITNYKIAQAHVCLQQYKEAVEYICQALNIARHTLGSEHRQVEIYENFLEQLRTKTNINVIPNGAVYG